jgi:ATP-dependent exoDNAse (exonuclease V) alpha subunit
MQVMIFVGDWRQLLPVIKDGEPVDQVRMCAQKLIYWRHVRHLKLDENMRVNNLKVNDLNNSAMYDEWNKVLHLIGKQRRPFRSIDLSDRNLLQRLQVNVVDDSDPATLIDIVFDGLNTERTAPMEAERYFADRAILCPTNEEVNLINNMALEMFRPDAEVHRLMSTDYIDESDPMQFAQVPVEVLNTIEATGIPQHQLDLKIGAIVMLTRNINSAQGLVNGTRLIVLNVHRTLVVCKIATGALTGQIVSIPRITIIVGEDEHIKFVRRQFPLRLAFALTIHKSQGQTFKKLGLFVRGVLFSHGHLYVAFSRVGDPRNIYIMMPSGDVRVLDNVVFVELFANDAMSDFSDF